MENQVDLTKKVQVKVFINTKIVVSSWDVFGKDGDNKWGYPDFVIMNRNASDENCTQVIFHPMVRVQNSELTT